MIPRLSWLAIVFFWGCAAVREQPQGDAGPPALQADSGAVASDGGVLVEDGGRTLDHVPGLRLLLTVNGGDADLITGFPAYFHAGMLTPAGVAQAVDTDDLKVVSTDTDGRRHVLPARLVADAGHEQAFPVEGVLRVVVFSLTGTDTAQLEPGVVELTLEYGDQRSNPQTIEVRRPQGADDDDRGVIITSRVARLEARPSDALAALQAQLLRRPSAWLWLEMAELQGEQQHLDAAMSACNEAEVLWAREHDGGSLPLIAFIRRQVTEAAGSPLDP